MDGQQAVELGRQALLMVLLLASPVLATVIVVGLFTSAFQTLTQMQDASLSQIPKLVAVALVLSAALPWLVTRLVEYSQQMFGDIPAIFGG